MKEALKNQEPKPKIAFRDKYLAAVITVAALLISCVASAQTTDSLKYSQINGYGFKYKRMAFDSVLMIPQSNSPHAPYRRGALRYQASDSTLQLWTGYQWNSIVTGVGNGVDTAYLYDDSTLAIETPDADYFVKIVGRHWDLQGVLNNGSTLTQNENIILADSLEFTSGWVIIDSLRLRSLQTKIDTTAYKPTAVNANGDLVKMSGWPTTGITELTGDVTAGPGSGSQATTIATNAVTGTKFRQSAALSVVGNPSNSTDDVIDITAGNDGNVLRRFGTSIGFGAINLASTNAVTGILPVANGGTGTATPSLVQGTNITITGTWPNQTINSTGGAGTLDATLALGGRLSADRSVSMGHKRWDLDSAALRLRSVDSVALSIEPALAGPLLVFQKPEGVSRTYPGSTPFKFLIETTTDDEPTERNNPVKWGWNVNGVDSPSHAGVWYSMEPNYRPGGARWIENILEVKLPNGTTRNSRLFMSTFKRGAGDSIESSENQWDFRGTGWSFMNLMSTVDYVSMTPGRLNINNNTTGDTELSIFNGSDEARFTMNPGTSILDYTGAKLRVNGAIPFGLKNGTSTERELIFFEGDGGTTGYIGKYNSAWAAQTHLQNGMVFLAANGTPTETMLLLKPGGTAWLGNLDAYNTGTQKVNISGSLALRGIGTTNTAPEFVVRRADSTILAMSVADAAALLGSGDGIYGGNGSLPSNVTVTGGNNSLTFDDIFAFHVNSDYNVFAKANGTGIYSAAVVGAGNVYEIGYTPTEGVFSKGAGVFIDTNNNVGIGVQPPTTMPLYATGASTFIQGLQSNHGNFYKVSNQTTDFTASLAAYFYTIDATAGNVTVTLPAASTAFGNTMGVTYKFQRIDNSGNTVTIQRAGGDTINGGTSFTLTTQWGVKMMQCTSTSTWAQY